MSSNLVPQDGVYNPLRRFAFTNITDDLFTFHWNKQPISVKAHETVELSHHLMVIATTALVDKIMIKKSKEDEIEGRKTDRFYRGASMLGVPAAREVYEKQIVRELEVDEESPQIAVMRSQIREQILTDIETANQKTAPVESVVASVNLENMVNVKESGMTEEFPSAKKGRAKKE